jgi:hypothetical protein
MGRLFATLAVLLWTTAVAAQVSPACEALRGAITRSAYRIHGPGAPIATLAAQIEQESACRSNAVSHANAKGLTQFIDSTAADMARIHPKDCAPANPFNPVWAITCRDLYMKSLVRATRQRGEGLSLCSRWMFGLQRFNGGYWIEWDRTAAQLAGVDADVWYMIEPYHGVNPRSGRKRTAGNHRENHEYPHRILKRQDKYIKQGWGSGLCR